MSEMQPGELFITHQIGANDTHHYANVYMDPNKGGNCIAIPAHAILMYVKSYWHPDWYSEWDENGQCYNYHEVDNLRDVFLYDEQLISSTRCGILMSKFK